MALTRTEVEEIATLARLYLAPDELDRIQLELGVILAHFEELAAVDTTGIPAMTHAVPMDLRLRHDIAEPSLSQDEALAAAPRKADGLIIVPSSIAPPGRTGSEP